MATNADHVKRRLEFQKSYSLEVPHSLTYFFISCIAVPFIYTKLYNTHWYRVPIADTRTVKDHFMQYTV